MSMGRIIQFPCNNYYEEWQYEEENYYRENYLEDLDIPNQYQDVGKENWFRRFVRKLLLFILSRL